MSRDREAPAKHVVEYLRVLGHRRFLFVAAFLFVLVGLVLRVLVATPVYASQALLQIDDAAAQSGLLGELQALRADSKAEAEVEIMRSHRVASGAFERLGVTDFLIEEHAYRPLDLLLRRLRGERPACEVRVDTEPLRDGGTWERYVFDFRGAHLAVEREDEESAAAVTPVPGFHPGDRFEAHGRVFVLEIDGDPAGRRFVLTLRSRAAGARWILERLHARERGRVTGVVELGFRAETPRLAKRVATALAESYAEFKRQYRREQARTAVDFLAEETARVRERLTKSERELDRFRAEAGAVLLSERAKWIVEKTSTLALERTEQRVRLEEWTGLRASEFDSHRILALIPSREADPLTLVLVGQVARLELEHDSLAERGQRPAHPERRRVEAELRLARERLQTTLSVRIDRTLERLRARIEHLDRTLDSYDEEARALPQTERRIAQLTRDAYADAKIHEFLVRKEQEAHIALVSTLGSARIIDLPLMPHERESPRIFLQCLVALVLAFVLAASLVFLVEYLDRSIKTPRELEEATGLELLATLPHFRAKRRAQGLVVADRPHSGEAESYRTLRTNLRFSSLDQPPRVVSVTSSVPGEGKTVANGNLAAAAAGAGERVLLIDADLRRPALHDLLGGRAEPGLVDVLEGRIGWREVARESRVPNLHAIFAGRPTERPGAILKGAGLRELVAEAREEFDLVVVDVPPILAVADTASFLHTLDGVLLLARARFATPEILREAVDQLNRVRAPLLGVIFNDLSDRRQAYRNYARYHEAPAPRRRGRGVAGVGT